MANISFLQWIIVLILLFLMFGDIQKLKKNFSQGKLFLLKKDECLSSKNSQEKRDSNP